MMHIDYFFFPSSRHKSGTGEGVGGRGKSRGVFTINGLFVSAINFLSILNIACYFSVPGSHCPVMVCNVMSCCIIEVFMTLYKLWTVFRKGGGGLYVCASYGMLFLLAPTSLVSSV